MPEAESQSMIHLEASAVYSSAQGFKCKSFGVGRLGVVSVSVANQTWSRVQALSKFGAFSSDMVAPERNVFCI